MGFNIREKLLEALITNHSLDRFRNRLNDFGVDEISNDEKEFILKYFEVIKDSEFNPRISFGIKIISLGINPHSKYYLKQGGREYYRINDFLGKDSTGNEIWGIVRNNKLITIMLRKSIQPLSKLGVDYIIDDVETFKNFANKGYIK